jgi:hypothetical protein
VVDGDKAQRVFASTTAGLGLNWYASGAIRLQVGGNGGWAFRTTSSAGVLANDTVAVIIGRDETGENYEVWVNGVKEIDSALGNPRLATDSTKTLHTLAEGQSATSSAAKMSLRSQGVIHRRVSDAEMAELGAWLVDNFGGTWV